MKRYALLLFAVACLSIQGRATQPEKILPYSRVVHPAEYYVEQARLWEKITGWKADSANAWYNFYRAARYANLGNGGAAQHFDLADIVLKMAASVPQSFEYQHVLYIQEPESPQRFERLLRAYELAPQRQELYHDLITYHVVQQQPERVAEFARRLYESGDFPAALLAWNYNALMSVEQDAVLLTHGDNDTYPAWVLQAVKDIRKDVKVLNINLLMDEKYRGRCLRELGIPDISLHNFRSYKDAYIGLARQMAGHSVRPIYFATSTGEYLREDLSDNLFLTGLAFKYAPQAFDNVAMLKNNFENRFLKDYLRVQLEFDPFSSVMNRMNLHYLPAFLLLHQHYTGSGEAAKAAEMEALLKKVATEGGREEDIAQYLGQRSGVGVPFETQIAARDLEKQFVKIKGKLHAAETETTNASYEAFLMDLLKNKEFDLLAICKSSKVDWRSLLPDAWKSLPDSEVFKHAHPDDPQAPVVNISHEAAQAYCEWITKVYNASTDKKKSFKKVLFRLPTEQEWELAAHASRDAPYPWGGYYVRNDKGCYLANYDVSAEQPCKDCPNANQSRPDDGGFFAVKVDSYFPNDLGLYNASGNVAEMIQEAGITKGGSWMETPQLGQISSRGAYAKPAPHIGFRVFMEIIE